MSRPELVVESRPELVVVEKGREGVGYLVSRGVAGGRDEKT